MISPLPEYSIQISSVDLLQEINPDADLHVIQNMTYKDALNRAALETECCNYAYIFDKSGECIAEFHPE